MVLGIRIADSEISEIEVDLDDDWDAAPIPALLGIPLRLKRLGPTEGKSKQSASDAQRFARLMTDPSTGFPAAAWRVGGDSDPLSDVLAARKDGHTFRGEDLALLDAFISKAHDKAVECHKRGKLPPDMFRPDAFKFFLQEEMSVALTNHKAPIAFLDVMPMLELRFPKGSKVKPQGLKKEELNGVLGTVVGRYDVESLRVGVEFSAPFGLLSIKAESLEPELTEKEWNQKVCKEYDFHNEIADGSSV
eukprot:TRINITY_DN114118_c0_g1_i1.p1 TRINITY_DN114118_c0_g1~~TRINITY_DN114118_c0_g1_i1.p1  ORF type:complete len:259 (+),score=57.58 TRINITY_DN114118_c0_g1_i1:36-779(+)